MLVPQNIVCKGMASPMSKLDHKLAGLIKPGIQALSAYPVPNSDGLLKLDAMENPYTWPAALHAEWLAVLQTQSLNRYPDAQAEGVKQALRKAMAIADDCAILLGNGSDEIIQMLLMAINGQHGVLTPTPGFVMYEMVAKCLALPFHAVPLNADFGLDRGAMLTAIQQHQPEIIFLAYPNNPTGNLFDDKIIEEIILQTPGLVIIDEAYAPFTDASYINRLSAWDNVLVMRTVSKMGLAGLRLGYLVGHPQWIEAVDKVRLPYNINVLTQQSVELALANKAIFDQQAQDIRCAREQLRAELAAIPGIQVFPSEANFLLFRVASHAQAMHVFDGLKHAEILIKNLSKAAGPLQGCLRVTVGRDTENVRFVGALKALLTP